MSYLVCMSFILLLSIMPSNASPQSYLTSSYFKEISNTHDLSLPDWGPYTKKYIGISHIPDNQKGIRFDLSVFPGLYRRKINVPNVFLKMNIIPGRHRPIMNTSHSDTKSNGKTGFSQIFLIQKLMTIHG